LRLSYRFWIRADDILYAGECLKTGSPCSQAFRENQSRLGREVQFRISGNDLFLRRTNGKESRITFYGTITTGSDGKPAFSDPYGKRGVTVR
jgi:hypothetical protein